MVITSFFFHFQVFRCYARYCGIAVSLNLWALFGRTISTLLNLAVLLTHRNFVCKTCIVGSFGENDNDDEEEELRTKCL